LLTPLDGLKPRGGRSPERDRLGTKNKKAGVAEHPDVIRDAGLLVNEPPAAGELPFVQSSDNFNSSF
jgi:hypothetical protein